MNSINSNLKFFLESYEDFEILSLYALKIVRIYGYVYFHIYFNELVLRLALLLLLLTLLF